MKPFILSVSILFIFISTAFAQENWNYDTVNIGGIKQVIATKGVKDGPLILFLHGGPGSSRMKQSDLFSTELQKKFLVVQWDQRESGKTLELNKTEGQISLNLMTRDTHDLIDTLLKRYHQKKVYLAGESWGTVLGFKMAQKYPELLYGYFAFSPVVDQIKSESLLLSKLQEDAKKKNNLIAKKELGKVKIPFSNSEQYYYLRKWWFSYDGKPFADKDTLLIKNYMESWSGVWLPTWTEAMKRNLFVELPNIKCPVYFFVGGKDYQTNCDIANAYYKRLSAPKKKMYWFDNAGHDVLVSDAPKVQRIIIDEILKD